MEGFEERLAEEVRKYPHLYDSSRRDYKDVQKTTNSWREIAEKLCVNEALCRQKWKNLRDRFTKAKKRMKSRSGDAGGKSIPAIFISLSWMENFVKHRDTETNFPESEGSQNLTQGTTIDIEREEMVMSPVPPPPSHYHDSNVPLTTICLDDLEGISVSPGNSPSGSSTPRSTTPIPLSSLMSSPSCQPNDSQHLSLSKKAARKRSAPASPTDVAILERLDSLKKIREERQARQSSEDGRFGETVSDILQKFPPKLKSEAKFAIHKILFEMEQKLYEHSEKE